VTSEFEIWLTWIVLSLCGSLFRLGSFAGCDRVFRPRLPAHASVVVPESGLLAAIPRTTPGRGRAESPAAARSEPDTHDLANNNSGGLELGSEGLCLLLDGD